MAKPISHDQVGTGNDIPAATCAFVRHRARHHTRSRSVADNLGAALQTIVGDD